MKTSRPRPTPPSRLLRSSLLALGAAAFAAGAAASAAAVLPGFGTAGLPVLSIDPGRNGDPLVVDVNEDGLPDLVVLQDTGSLELRRGKGEGTFGPPSAVPKRSGGFGFCSGDFDRDGHVDLAVLRTVPGTPKLAAASVLLGDGTGAFVETDDSGAYPFASPFIRITPAASDLDGDGLLDLAYIAGDPDDGNLRLVVLLRGDGHGGFSARTPVRTTLRLVSLAASDLDRDGLPDLVGTTTLHRGGAVYALKGTGSFGFAPPVPVAAGNEVVVTEFDGDGVPDLATASTYFCPGCASAVYLGDGALGFRLAFSAFPGSYGAPGPVAAGDVDGDGATDLLASAETNGLLAIYPGNGKGGFREPVRLRAPYGSRLADLDGDHRPDLLFGTPAGWAVRRNTSGQGNASSTLVLPVALEAAGEAGSWYATSLTVANRGETTALLESTFTDAATGATRSGSRALGAGDQVTSGLDALGLPRPPSGYRGTVRVRVSGASAADAVSVLALVQSPAGTQGSVGVAFGSVPAAATLDGPSLVPWLREGDGDRTNLAVLHAGGPDEGAVTLRVTIHPGEAGAEAPVALPDVVLAPGAIRQVDRGLAAAGLASKSGWALVERVSGSAAYLAYAVVNDAANSDGSWVPAVPADRGRGEASLLVPVLVESDAYVSELVVTNASARARRLSCTYVAEAVAAPGDAVRFKLDLPASSQVDWPAFVAALRLLGYSSLVPKGPRYAGALSIAAEDGDLEGIAALARTLNPAPAGRYGVATPALFASELAKGSAWLHGIVQDSARRTNLAIVNGDPPGREASTFLVEVYHDAGGTPLFYLFDLVVPAGGWLQLNSFLSDLGLPGLTTAYVRVVRHWGTAPFLAYAVGNDGPGPGEGTGDGAFVPMQVPDGGGR